ncbi:MAG: hypothetical protein QNJ44_09910 [Rhodobacter sp.]|nr:hypothetical protein [Rhodobacter sp.]
MSYDRDVATEIADAIGPVATAHLLAERGGSRIDIPVKAKGSALARVIGEDATARMIAAFGCGALVLPLGNDRGRAVTRIRAMAMLAVGASLIETARACEIHIRTVSRFKAEMKDRGWDRAPRPDLAAANLRLRRMGDNAPVATAIAAAIGPELAEDLLAAHGGDVISVPVSVQGTELADTIGEDAAARLIEALGTGRIALPTGIAGGQRATKRRALEMLAQGAGSRDVARACKLNISTVQKYRRERKRKCGPE